VAGRYAQNRHPCHAYLDYALAYVAFSSTVPLLLSHWISSGEDSSSEGDVSDSGGGGTLMQQVPLILSAAIGGSLLSLGNMSTQWATTVYASPLTTVLALQASLTVVLGTTINYKLEPSKTARPKLLAMGIMLFLVAIGLSVMAHRMYSSDEEHQKKDTLHIDRDGTNMEISMRDLTSASSQGAGGTSKSPARPDDYRACTTSTTCSSADDARGQRESKPFQSISDSGDSDCFIDDGVEKADGHSTPSASTIGLAVAFCGGLCFGFFSPAFNIAVNNPFGWGTNGESAVSVGLSFASANLWFSLAFTATSIFWNIRLMRKPPRDVDPSTIQRYLSDHLVQDRAVAILAGLICAAGNVLQFQGGHLAGFATSDLVQAFPLIATFFDVTVFGEFNQAHRMVIICLVCMYLVYIGGIILLASSVEG